MNGKTDSVSSFEPQILLIEGKRSDYPTFFTSLNGKGYMVDLAVNGNDGLSAIREEKPDIVIVNAASMRTSGRRICKSIHDFDKRLAIIVIIDKNNDTRKPIDAEVVLELPFTLQKLINRIKLLVPSERNYVLTVGDIQFDPDNNWVRCGDRQASLTPRLTELLRVLMERPGEIIPRSELFQRVWETTYMGDTRTMDVHISWLRQALEEDPRHPRYIKTIRGIGYRFDALS